MSLRETGYLRSFRSDSAVMALLRPLIFLLAWLALQAEMRAQGDGVDLIQAVVSGPLTGHGARTITDHLAAHPGVRLCRVDPVSRNMLLHVDAAFRMDERAIRHLFRMHGLHLRCYSRSPRTDAPFRLLDPRACGLDQSTR